MVSGQLPPRKIAPWLGLGFWLRFGLVLGLGASFFGDNYPRTIENARHFGSSFVNWFFIYRIIYRISSFARTLGESHLNFVSFNEEENSCCLEAKYVCSDVA